MGALYDIFADDGIGSLELDEYLHANYNLEQIIADCIKWTPETDEHRAGCYFAPEADEFWAICQKASK